ncbi:hypothetical protein ABZV29_38875 [Streptomyces sp. NPDC005236]|uniref:hypothetical protein n=1 Tax=Streptomyces sp. NPDC005236 TaxID=3157028 RepID=UPI0033B8F1D5
MAPAAIDRLEDQLAGHHAYHATRADLLRRLGRSQQSRASYGKAIDLAGNTAETAYLTRRRDQLRWRPRVPIETRAQRRPTPGTLPTKGRLRSERKPGVSLTLSAGQNLDSFWARSPAPPTAGNRALGGWLHWSFVLPTAAAVPSLRRRTTC